MTYFFKKMGNLLLVMSFAANAIAQKEEKDFKKIDEYIKKMGTLDSMNMGTISNLLTKNFTDKTDKARAIFDWIAYNINYDIKNAQNGGTEKNSSTEVLLYRKATGMGYANLFQDMCSSAGIRCLTANGFVKFNADEINNTSPDINHSWAVVQLGQSPDTWYYVDACFGSGYPDAAFKNFTKAFNPNYFFANPIIFNWQHYPDNKAWQLGQGPKTKKEFFNLPVIDAAAYDLGLQKIIPGEGTVKIKVGKPLSFSYVLNNKIEINTVAIVLGKGKKIKTVKIPFLFTNHTLAFTYKFEEQDSYPITILVNDKKLIEYNVDIQ